MAARALVTGASSGIGAAVASRLLEAGWEVLGMGRSAPPEGCQHIEVDLEDNGAAAEALDGVGVVDAIVHAAGLLRVGQIDALDRADGWMMWRLHVDTAVQIVARLAPAMPDGGRIVLLGSRVADGVAGRSQYAASKAALLGLARSWAAELAPRRITVNVVAPGATDTPMLRDPARDGSPPQMSPMGRLIQPEEIAGLVAFLLGDDAANLTGQRIVVCGGASL
jgi:NAD(P)-dependent dehydrogenase (short-subunit alcohol dehydrogenase family)